VNQEMKELAETSLPFLVKDKMLTLLFFIYKGIGMGSSSFGLQMALHGLVLQGCKENRDIRLKWRN